MPTAGCRFVILDAKSKSISFYQKIGFRLLDTEANKTKEMPLMFLDLRSLIDKETALIDAADEDGAAGEAPA